MDVFESRMAFVSSGLLACLLACVRCWCVDMCSEHVSGRKVGERPRRYCTVLYELSSGQLESSCIAFGQNKNAGLPASASKSSSLLSAQFQACQTNTVLELA